MKQVIQNYNNIFYSYVSSYDLNDSNLLRKMIHSYEVARNCFAMASRKGLSEKERNFCYLMGLFHDVGRFKQWQIYHTYDDVKSVDHGDLSCGNIIYSNNDFYEKMILGTEAKIILVSN